jgi:1,4-dihydroxy-6-naphthoate synthase
MRDRGDQPLRLGISPCPNDTFTFAGILAQAGGGQRLSPLDFEVVLRDVQELNEALARGEFDVAKASFHAALHLKDNYGVLPVGAALGFGVGPILLAATSQRAKRLPEKGDRVLCPGGWTTAALLFQILVPNGPKPRHCIFSEIIPALESGEADYGVVIHEGRFTFQERGLHLVTDLGEAYEQETGMPVPLGGILARKDLSPQRLEKVVAAIRCSLEGSRKDPQRCFPIMAQHAQELSEEVLWEHVRLYVNDATLELGDSGRMALKVFEEKARCVGVVPEGDFLKVW